MQPCPACRSRRIKIYDKGLKRIWRFLQGDSRLVCRECHTTWREKTPTKFLKIKRKRTD